MDHRTIARELLALLCALQGIATLAVDLNRTHATNPRWPGHARFHLVWQDFTIFLLAAFTIFIIVWRGPFAEQRFFLALLLELIPLLAFLIAFAARRLYAGTLCDPNGIPPARIPIAGRVFLCDLNLVAILGALASLAAIFFLYTRA
ncbi:MAG: hypothetical protein P4L10_15075 [Acidobacteriaceae bacterium]|nr:hypothetical protein [Acidobacteriaceae bacterium]